MFLEITRALIPLLALRLNQAYPVSSVLFRLATFRPVSWPLPTTHSTTLLRNPLPFRCILRAKFNLPFFAPKSLGSVCPKREESAFGFTFSLFLIYFSFYALLRLQLPPANFDLLLLQFLDGAATAPAFFFPARLRCHLKLSGAFPNNYIYCFDSTFVSRLTGEDNCRRRINCRQKKVASYW